MRYQANRENVMSQATIFIGDSRSMGELPAEGVNLVVTSPPYWHIKDYGKPDQIGYGQSLHAYLIDLYHVWMECFRLLVPGSRLCINIGDQFARAAVYGRYKVIPLHAEVIGQCERIGFDFMGSIIWQKKTTMNTSGGATVMGSFPYPASGIVEIDYEYVHIFKKPGRSRRVAKDIKEASRLTKREWKEYFKGHWCFAGARKTGHEAMFPLELPHRLIKMFSFVGDTVLDPFLGSGTTVKAGLRLGRSVIGYEINEEFVGVIKAKLGHDPLLSGRLGDVEFVRTMGAASLVEPGYVPGIQDARPQASSRQSAVAEEKLYRVTRIADAQTLEVDAGFSVRIMGVSINDEVGTLEYLRRYVLGREVFLRPRDRGGSGRKVIRAYVYLKNKIFINAHLIKSGLGSPDSSVRHRLAAKFMQLRRQANA